MRSSHHTIGEVEKSDKAMQYILLLQNVMAISIIEERITKLKWEIIIRTVRIICV